MITRLSSFAKGFGNGLKLRPELRLGVPALIAAALQLTPAANAQQTPSPATAVSAPGELAAAKPRLLLINAQLELEDCKAVEKQFAALSRDPQLRQNFAVEVIHPDAAQFKSLQAVVWQLPMILLCDNQGRAFDFINYFHAVDAATLANLLAQKNRRLQQREHNWQQAAGLQGRQRAELLAKGFKSMPPVFYSFYRKELDELQQADSTQGCEMQKTLQQHDQLRRLVAEGASAAEQNDMAKLHKLAADFLARQDLMPQIRQAAVMFFEINPLLGNLQEPQMQQMQQRLSEVIALDPDSHVATEIALLKQLLQQP